MDSVAFKSVLCFSLNQSIIGCHSARWRSNIAGGSYKIDTSKLSHVIIARQLCSSPNQNKTNSVSSRKALNLHL